MSSGVLVLALSLLASVSPGIRPERQLLDVFISDRVTPSTFVYNWRDAVLMNALADTYRIDARMRPRIESYAVSTMSRFTATAHGRHPNAVAAAVGFAFLKEIGRGNEDTDAALQTVLDQYENIPRSSGGACSHRHNTVELWDDTVYMLDMALLGTFRATGDSAYLYKLARELELHASRLEDPRTGLWYHGWAESLYPTDDVNCEFGWNTNPLHRNDEFWGRGNGWVAMAYADVLEFLPRDGDCSRRLVAAFTKMMGTLLSCRDGRSGMWYQLPLRRGERGNFIETSCTAMFAYAMAKGVRTGILPEKYASAALKAYRSLVGTCIENTGEVHLTGICEGTCIGSREYYYSRALIKDESYAVGALVMLGNELQTLKLI